MLEPRTLLAASVLSQGLSLAASPAGHIAALASPIVATTNRAPTVASPARASSNPVTSATVQLSVLGGDDGGEASLKYSWATNSVLGTLAPTFSFNNTNAAKVTTVTFKTAGIYLFTATSADSGKLTTSSSVTVTVSATLARICVIPSPLSILTGATQQFSATALDQFGTALAIQPSFLWTTTVGSVTSGGLFTAPATAANATATVVAKSALIRGTASILIQNRAPTVATPAAAASNPVTGTSVQLSVLGADDAGESNLTYTWTTNAGLGYLAPTLSVNGTNAAKHTTVTFKKAGSYVFTATITDSGKLTTTSSVTVVVGAVITKISVSPATFVITGATQQFAATGVDQFGNAATPPGGFVWSTSGGVITSGGLLTAPWAGGIIRVVATCGATQGAVNVMIAGAPTLATAATAAATAVSGTKVALSSLGAYDAGEGNLKYTWTTAYQSGQGPAPTFSVNGTNASKHTTVTFKEAGTYVFTATITDNGGRWVSSSVVVNVNQTLAAISVSPSTASLFTGATQQLVATALDQFGNALANPPNVTWATTAGSVTSNGLFTAPGNLATATVTASGGTVKGTAILATLNRAPTVATPAAASVNAITNKSVQLSVLGADDAGEATLKYTWTTSTLQGSSLFTFSVNGTNAAKNTVVTVKRAGTYVFTVTITDCGGLTTTSSVTVVVNPTVASISVGPAISLVSPGATQQFTATAVDQFGNVMAIPPALAWTASAGTITAGGLYTAPGTPATVTITAAVGTLKGTLTVGVANQPPTVATAAAAYNNPVTTTYGLLSVFGADDAGESNLTYSWSTTTLPLGAVAPVISASGTNAAKYTVVSFRAAGTYVFTATITDGGGLSVTSNVTVFVNPTLTSIAVSPGSVAIAVGATQQFSATGFDQFGNALAIQPAFSWSTTAGTISGSGLFSAPNLGGYAFVTGSSGLIQGDAYVVFS